MSKFVLFLKGLLMGAADIVPGVSGGTIALIVGIYEELIGSIRRVSLRNLYRSVNWGFFIPLGVGIGTAFLVLSRPIHFMLESHTAMTYAFFFGLILASAIHVTKTISSRSWSLAGYLLLGMIGAFCFVGLNPIEGQHHPAITVVTAIIAISAMLLPGISGSFLLLLLGQYHYVIKAIKAFDMGVLIPFACGALGGALLFARLLQYLLGHFRAQTLAVLVGIMLGALRLPYRYMFEEGQSGFLLGLVALGGFICVAGLEWAAGRTK